MNLINKILLESEEDENLFRPRRVEDRINKIEDPIERKVLQYNYDEIIDVYLPSLSKYLKAKLISGPIEDNKGWMMLAKIFIKKEDVKKGQLYGIYENFLYYSKEFDKWVMYGTFIQNKYNPAWEKVYVK